MIKRIFCFVLALISIASFGIIGISAANNAETEEQIIYFEIPESWEGYSKVYCHIWEREGSSLANWGSKKTLCYESETQGIYAYDISKVGGIEEDKQYFVVFSTDINNQHHREVLFSTECLGDTLYCSKAAKYDPNGLKYHMAYWKNQDPTRYGSFLPRYWGDVDYSGEVNIKDATTVQKFIAGILDKDTPLMQDADFNWDSEINIKDVTDIQKYLAGLLKILQL